jgi:hypothetical protein
MQPIALPIDAYKGFIQVVWTTLVANLGYKLFGIAK